MKNSYSSVSSAKKSFFNTRSWKFSREFFKTVPNSVAICKNSENGKFFIVTNTVCVNYRKTKGEVVKIII